MRFTNGVLECSNPRVQRGTNEHVSADALVADFNRDEIYLTNGLSTTEPQEFAEVIGPQIRRAIEPYRWSRPPTIRAHGIIPMHGEEQADLRFHVEGGPFHWYRLNLPEISSDIHWKGMTLTLSNVNAAFYGGRAEGSAGIFFNPDKGPDYQFRLVTTNSSLKGLMADVKPGTNHLEGSLGGTLNVTKGNADQWPRFDGYGDVSLRDGLIWDFPLFGIFSPVLNAVSPGLGNNRARHGTSSFTVTNGVFYSDNLDIRSTGMRLQYRGTLDVEGNVNARVEAGLLRDVWVVGPVISTVLWPFSKFFEYKVSGSLDQLKLEPLYLLPKLMVLPFKTLKAITPGADTSGSRPNAPPKSP
jgi:hypothetical protein